MVAHPFQQPIDTSTGNIPKEWSFANISHVFKTKSKDACTNHPVSITCEPCKMLEHSMYSKTMDLLNEHTLQSDKMLLGKDSCETQVTTAINDWAKSLDNTGQVNTFM